MLLIFLFIFLFMSSWCWFTDAISPFISLRILFIVLLFAGFSFLCFLIFFGVFHGPFVPIVFSGSVFRSCFQMTGILGCHLFFRSETLGDHFVTYKDTEPLKNENVLDKKFKSEAIKPAWGLLMLNMIHCTVGGTEKCHRSSLHGSFYPLLACPGVQAWPEACFWRQVGKGG